MAEEQVEFVGKLPPKPTPDGWMPPKSIRPTMGIVIPVAELGAADHIKFGEDLFDDGATTYYEKSLSDWTESLRDKPHGNRSIQNIAMTVFVARERQIIHHLPEEERETLLLRNARLAYLDSLRRRYKDLQNIAADSMTQILGIESAEQVMVEIKSAV